MEVGGLKQPQKVIRSRAVAHLVQKIYFEATKQQKQGSHIEFIQVEVPLPKILGLNSGLAALLLI